MININKHNSCYGFINIKNTPDKQEKSGKILSVKYSIREDIKKLIENLELLDKKDDFYICKANNIKSLATVLYYDNPRYIIEYVQNRRTDSFTCPVDASNKQYTLSYNYEHTNSFVDKINKGKIDEFEYLNKIGANKFYMNHDKFVITPNLSHYLLDEQDIIKFNNLHDAQDKINFLSKTSFILYLKDPEEKYKSIFDLTVRDINLLEELKDNISGFLERLVNKKLEQKNYYRDFYVKNMNKYIKHNLIMIDFGVFDFTKYYKYDSYIHIFQRYNLDDAIYVLKDGRASKIVNYLKIDGDYRYVDKLCKNKNPLYDYYKDREQDKYNKKSGGGIFLFSDNFEIINEYSKNTLNQSPYCCISVLLKSRDKYYELRIKTITFDYLNVDKEFKNSFVNSVLSQEFKYNMISENTIDRLTEKQYNMRLPAILSVSLKEYVTNPLGFYYFMNETKQMYDTLLEKYKNITIDRSIIITDIHINLLIKHNCMNNPDNLKYIGPEYKKIVELINKHHFMKYMFEKKYYLSKHKNFYIINAIHDNPENFVLWYLPRINIKNLNEYIQLLELCLSEQDNYKGNSPKLFNIDKNVNSSLLSMNQNHKLDDLIRSCTDFFNLYQEDPDFMYNIRHKTKEQIEEIDELLHDFYYNFYKNLNVQNFYELSNSFLLVYAHYPITNIYNIFHLHITGFYDPQKRVIDRPFLFKYNYESRIYMWNISKYIDYSKKDIYISYSQNIGNKSYGELISDEHKIINSFR